MEETNVQIKKSYSPLVLGILSAIFWLFPIVGIPVSIAGIIVSAKKMKSENSGQSKWGLGLSIAGIVLSIANMVIGAFLLNGMMNSL